MNGTVVTLPSDSLEEVLGAVLWARVAGWAICQGTKGPSEWLGRNERTLSFESNLQGSWAQGPV